MPNFNAWNQIPVPGGAPPPPGQNPDPAAAERFWAYQNAMNAQADANVSGAKPYQGDYNGIVQMGPKEGAGAGAAPAAPADDSADVYRLAGMTPPAAPPQKEALPPSAWGPPASAMQVPPPAAMPPEEPPPAAPVSRGTPAAPKTPGLPTKDALTAAMDALNSGQLGAMKDQGDTIARMKKQLGEAESKALPVDLSGLASLTDAWTGSHFAQTYKPDETPKDRAATIDAMRKEIIHAEQGLTKDQVELLRGQLQNAFQKDSLEYRKQHDADLLKVMRQKSETGEDKASTARLDKLMHDLNPGLASSRSDLGRNQATITAAKKLETLGQQGDAAKGGLTPSQMAEAGTAAGALVGGGNTTALGMANHFIPASVGKDEASVKQWFTDEPQGANQQAFAHQLMETAAREKHTAMENIKEIQADSLAGLSDLSSHPRYQQVQKRLFGKEDLDQNGKYMRKTFELPGGANAAKTRAEKIKALEEHDRRGGQ